ncbi:E3 ubiquitin-protein ligase rnf213-alpha isoform X2 [Lepisosteus oculatus]|uniref:E3 ubiquitin-protein ligase rnf213-alpha isoform X2 n=1 Tax=Lepisosteus oculatus TaxID=7918 RepID=UPI0037179D36
MKCSDCGHVAAEQNAKFCSECGKKLSQSQAPSQGKTPPVLEDQLKRGDEQRTDSEPSSVESTTMQHNEQKRHSEDEDCPKKKRKKKKDKRKKSKQSSSLESEEMATELSDISLADKPTSAVEEEAVPSDSEDESGAMDDTAALVQEAGRSTQPVNTNTASQEPCPGSPAQVQKTRKMSDSAPFEKATRETVKTNIPPRVPAGSTETSAEGRDSSFIPSQEQTGSVVPSTEGSSSSRCSHHSTPEASASSPGAVQKPAEPERQKNPELEQHTESSNSYLIPPQAQTGSTEQSREGSNSSPTPHRAQTGSAQRSTEGSSSSHCSRNATREASASSPGAEPKPAEPARQQDLEQKPQAAGKPKQPQTKATDNKSVKSGKDMANVQQTKLVQNAAVEQTRQTAERSKNDALQNQKINTTTSANKGKAHASQNKAKADESVSHGNKSLKKEELVENSLKSRGEQIESTEVQQSPSSTDSTPISSGISEQKDSTHEQSENDDFKVVTRKKKNKEVDPPKNLEPSQLIPAADRLTICFHAVLSKDFKLNPQQDLVYLRAGERIGSWDKDTVKMDVTRNLGEHGFLVEGRLVTSKKHASVSIPYKYVVYKYKGKKYEMEFEHIYKLDTQNFVNRCLFIKPHLLSEQGEWHQYDDIICVEPSKGVMARLKNLVWSEEKNKVVKGRQIAGKFMLETIFEPLQLWGDINWKSCFTQLNQFYETYKDPFVYEDTHKRWSSLEYGEKEVKSLLKEFMIERIVPQLQKNNELSHGLIKDPLKAGVIMLVIWTKYHISLETGEMSRLCNLLCLPNKTKEEFILYWTDFMQSIKNEQCILDSVRMFCQAGVKSKLVKWVLIIPLLHLLRSDCQPFESLPVNASSKYTMSWVGLEGIKLMEFESSSQDRRAIMKVMTANKHLVEVDRLVSRSWMCLLNLEDLAEYSSSVPVDLLDILHGFMFKLKQEISYSNYEVIQQLLSHLFSKASEQQYSCDSYGETCFKTAVKLLENICNLTKDQRFYEIPISCMNLVIVMAEFAGLFPPVTMESGDTELECKNNELQETLQMIRNWIKSTFRNKLLNGTYYIDFSSNNEIEAWNSSMSLTFGSKEFTSFWRDTLRNDFEGKLKREPPMNQIEIYCSKNEEMSNTHPHISRCLEKCALESVNSICQEKSEGRLFEKLKRHDFRKFGKLVSTIIEKSWPRDSRGQYRQGDEVLVEHLLNWSAAKNIFQLQGADGKLVDQLTDDAKELIAIASSAFVAITNQFIRGDIQIKILKYIFLKKTSFIELLKIEGLSDCEQCKDTGAMKRLLQWREAEVKSVMHEKKLVESLLAMCRKINEYVKVNLEELESKCQSNIEVKNLGEFMVVHRLEEISSEEAGLVTYFHLDEETRQMAETLHTLKDSYIFEMCWENQAKELAAGDLNEDEETEPELVCLTTPGVINEEIFEPCYEIYRDIYSKLKKGILTLEEVDNVFEVYKNRYVELEKELQNMCKVNPSDDRRWITIRIQQIQQYHELHLAVESAQVIMDVKNTLQLNGDFQVLQTLLSVTQEDFKRESMDRIDNDLIQAKKILVDITEDRRKCLLELGLRRNFVFWVKGALEDINELKVFVDLASISAGENDLDVDRVACFHDAVLGYSSILYDLKPDTGFSAFKDALKKLWKAFDNDPNLPKKLCDTARHLEWLKTVKDSHGSVELSSLSLASAINQKGIYIISLQYQKKVNLDTALKLKIPEEHEDGQDMRCYSLEDLKELQNKLMLMSGKGEQGQCEVERFAEVFSSVQRLAISFIDLHAAGNMLFRDWEANINCSEHSEASIIIDFNLENTIGEIMFSGSVVEELPDICKKMEKCLKFWKEFMDRKRSQHYFLNYYTAEQIVYLCKKLTPDKQDSLEDQVLMLLSFITPNCTISDIRECWHKWQYDDLKDISQPDEEMDFQTFVDETNMEVDIFLESKEGTYTLEDLPALLHSAKGAEKLDLVWNFYMRDMKHFLPNCIDIGTLGKLLEILATKEDKEKKTVQRNLPNGLQQGCPNLIICPHDEILTSCICIYMSSMDEDLPTYDEVLLCSASTPYEQVEIFLRRCLTEGYKGKKIYTMLYADELSYDVSYRFEQLFQRLKMECRGDYRLVIICNSDREHFYIPSAFSQHKVHMIPHERLDKVQAYLSGHYTVSTEVPTAASVFKDRMFVGIVSSKRAGVGKSLYIRRLQEKLKQSTRDKSALLKCIRLIEPRVNENAILQSLLNTPKKKNQLTIFHFDITSSVQKGLYEFLFTLLVLHYLMDTEGHMWKCSNKHLYVIEILETSGGLPRKSSRNVSKAQYVFLDIFPKIFCRPPKEVLELEMRIQDDRMTDVSDPLMDDQEFRSEAYQRPYQYLTRFHNKMNLDSFTYRGVEGTHVECLQMFFVYCGIVDPSWAELRNFAWFLNLQLKDSETSVFCDVNFTGDTLQGFKNFVVDFMIMMAKDFATPSLSISDQSPGRQQVDLAGVNEEDLAPFRIRKKWESEPHPYIFFNDDHISMTFIGFHLRLNDQNMVDAIDPSTQKIIKKNIMTKQLYDGLRLQRVPFNIDFDKLPRGEKIERLCNVLGIQWPLDPDETYELTTDNILKMLAIHMRFRCGIPVIIMGETGCGKTRLIKFLCELRRSGAPSQNMKLVKVHGGTSAEMIYTKVREAMSLALINKEEFLFDSVLFFDEANTTEAVSSIKEILCDNTVEGEPLCQNTGLQIIAACNPYRKHTDLMIQRLESAGLGYRVRAEETEDKLGSIPLRQLVYRVQALPPSMIPLVWDFGQLNDQTERMYIQQIVQRVIQTISIHANYIKMITEVLSCSQIYMRQMKDECSFVSLRDVERCMQVFVWFYRNHTMLLEELHAFETKDHNQHNDHNTRDPVVWSLIMAVGVCYHACLEKKEKYRKKICKHLPETNTHVKVMQEISLMQDLLLSGVPLGKTIAKNNALKENVFMMVICIELRIPLFLVGKPGSSKSLAKTLVADAMQGHAAHSELYKKLKQIHLVSFQCSPHSTPEGIINTFKQCARFQEGKNLTEYISVVVLDEIGLAEDSPKMPLKTLHPLLEEGCIDDEPLPHKKVGFIGISNWALDPAKMNRGIFVSRGDPDEKELIESAKGICSSEPMILKKVQGFFQVFARAYLNICKEQGKEFFGLRDYYSLIKMVFAMTKASDQEPSAKQIVEAVLRNFSGRDDVDTVAAFTSKLKENPEISTMELVRQNIEAVGQDDECRYLLVLTKNYAALQILQQTFFSDQHQPEIIFGSSFPKDQEYTQICRNINRVKICMETGQTIVLLNLQNLYESLYDALNQYYVCLGGQKYVDLGLGTHRVKCRVHRDFRLIVIEEKEVVYKQFPIPLINRLEKHYLDINTVLKSDQKQIVKELEKWVKDFTALNLQHSLNPQAHNYVPSDVFIGYHSDTCASVVLQVTEKLKGNLGASEEQRKVLQETKLVLLNCATPDSVVRLSSTCLSNVETEELANAYFETQKHDSLASFILSHVLQEERSQTSFTEVTTFSRLLTASDVDRLLQDVISFQNVELLSLQQFDTEHSFLKKIRSFLDTRFGNKILIIQTDFVEDSQSSNLIASAKYSAINEINKSRDEMTEILVYFITKLPRMEGGTSYVGFHGGPWRSVHIDDLRKSKDIVSDITTLKSLTISQLFEEREKPNKPEAMETDDTKMESPTPEENADLEDILDTTALVRSCVQSAVGMLRDQHEGGSRSTRRLEILLTLLAENEETKASFLKTMKRRLHALLVTHDENTPSPKNWVFKEASNIDALQEGGTFRHTLWKRVQAVVIPFLAQVISMIDRDCNLDLLVDSNSVESVKKLWLEIFGNLKLLYIPYTKVDRNSESKTILVQNYMKLDHNLCSTMPFSWRIKDHLDELWVHVLQREGHTHNQLEEFFKKTPLGRYIADADEEMQKEFFHRYLQDFISMTMKVTSPDELMLLRSALLSCVNELKIRSNANKEKVTSLPWVHTAYHEFKTRLQNLSRMITIEPQVAQFLPREGAEMVLDVYAAVACVELLEPHNLDTDGLCLEWLRRVKRLQVPIELVCAEECVQNYGSRSQELVKFVRSGWNRIFSSSLFVEHVLLGIESVQKDLKVLVVAHARKLWKSLEQNSDFKMEQPFLAVIEVLKSCKDEASERLFRFGRQLCAVCLGEPTDPLCLPCEHIYCLVCIKQWLLPGQMYCPLCMVEVPQNFELKVSEDIRHLVQLYAQFRKRCNAFFIDMVSTLCFKDNSPPSDSIILHLLSFLMVDTNAVPNIKKGRRVYTKALSPFNDSVDKNPVVRSVVLKFLLKYSFDDVKRYLQEHLSSVEQSNILEKTDKTKLCALYINCLEDSMYEKTQSQTELETVASLEQETRFLQCCVQNTEAGPEKISIEYLQSIARIRLCLDTAACLLVKDLSGLATGTQQDPEVYRRISAFLNHVMEFCRRSKNDWYRIYMIRKICNQKGMEFVQTLLTKPEFHWLFPEEIVQQNEHTGQIDQYLVCGINYQAFRDAVGRAMIECKTEGIEEANKNCRSPLQKKTARLLLAIFREVTTLYRAANQNVHPKPEQCQAIEDFIKGSQIFGSPELKNLATSLVYNRLGDLSVRPDCTSSEHTITELAIHLTTVLLCGQDGILTPLKQLALAPVNMQNAFLPTMPEDMLVVAVQVLGNLQWYSCPNGHPCTIGECGQPMERSHCVDCGAVIGGDNHRAVQGFQQTNFTGDRTQTGHVLGDARRRDNPDMLDTKSMSPAPFILIRLLTHLAMLLGASRDPRSISQMIKPAVQNPHVFLVNHLVKDMEQLSRTLGKGTDDSVNIVHLLLSRLLEPHQAQQWPVPYDNILSTKEARNGWETVIATEIITPQLKSLERRLKEVNDLIRKDSRVSSSPIMKVIYGDPHIFLKALPLDKIFHCSAIWSCRERVSVQNLAHIVEQHDGKDTLPVLWKFLQKEAELKLVKFLPDILALQRNLVRKFQNVTEHMHKTIGDFIQSQKAESLKAWYETRICTFLTVWNQLRASLVTNGEIKISEDYCKEDLNLDSEFQVLLPQRHGLGLCSTALVSYLIALHNELVYTVEKHTGEENSYSVSPADLTDLHVIKYEVEKDLIPLILSNCQYSMEQGQETVLEYDLHKTQQQILNHFLQGKPLITLTGIPTLVNRQDRNYENIFKDVKGKLMQDSLPALMLNALSGELQSYTDVCEALSVVEVTLGFLAMTGGEAEMQLVKYVQDILQMGDQTAPHILKIKRREKL